MSQGKNKCCRPWYSWPVENKALGIYAKFNDINIQGKRFGF